MNGIGAFRPAGITPPATGLEQPARQKDETETGPASARGVYGSYVGGCMGKTFVAFGLPAAIAPFVGPPASVMYASQAFAALRQLDPPTVIQPQPTVGEQRNARVLSFLPFVATFAAQGHLTARAADPSSAMGKLAQATDAGFRTFRARLPGPVSRALSGYPFNFVVARNLAQLGGSAAGAVLSDMYLRQATGGERVHAERGGKAGPPFSATPLVFSAGLFAVPAMLAAAGQSIGARLGPVGTPAFMATALITSAILTDDLTQSYRRNLVPAPEVEKPKDPS